MKLRSRLSAYSKQLKPKRADELSEMDKLRLHRQHEQCSKALQSALLNWDKANVAAGWLERDFDLVYAQLVAHSALHTMLHTRDDIKARLGQTATNEQHMTATSTYSHTAAYHSVSLRGYIWTALCELSSDSAVGGAEEAPGGQIAYLYSDALLLLL